MRRGLAIFDRLGRAQALRGAVSLVQLVALLVTSLVLPIPQAEAQSDPWALTPGLTARAVFSCDDLTLNNASSADSAPDAGQGHVGTNGRIALNAASTVLGNATPGPGKAVVRTGGSTVSGSTAPASLAVPCAPVSLTGLASTLPGSNANATIPRTAQNRDPLSGPNRTVFSMTSGDTLQLAAGTYYFTRFTLAGAAKVSVAGPVRIFVAGEVQLGGGSWLNQSGNPANVRLFGNGPRLELTASSELNAFVYVPAAQVDLTNQSRIVGGLWARRVTLNASKVTKRTALSAPTLTITEPAEGATLPNLASLAVSGVAQDADGPVTLTLNGQTVSVGANGVFTATLDLSSTQPPAITAVASDGDGFTTVVVRTLGNCRQPTVRLVSPLPGALLGSRTVPVAVEADSATTVTVNGVAATLDGGVFRIAALDLMGDGVRTLQLNASNVCGSASATETVDVDTQVPIVALDTPVNGLVVATPTLSVGGTVSDAHLDTVTVNGLPAAITAGRFRADLALQPGPNTLTAVARDRLGRQTTSNTVTVTYAPSSADFTLRTELRGQAVFSCEELKVSGNAGTSALASAGPVAVAGDVVSGQGVSVEGNATVDGNASAGPGASVRVLGAARVLGQRRVLSSAPPCLPVDLAPIAAALAQTNDNATIGLTSQGRSPLGGPGGTEFTLQPGETLTLSPGAYYFTRFTVSPGASLSTSGLVKILCAGEIDWRGNLNTAGSPYDLRVFSTGAVMGMQGTATARAFVYAPAAQATLTGGELLGSLFARRVEIRGGARVVRRMDLAPPQLTLSAPLPGEVVGDLAHAVVAGTVTDADSPVVVRVNGLPATVSNGTFTRTLDMSGVLPPFALVIAEDAAGQTAQLQATVCDGPPQVVLVSPAPGTVVGQRIVSVGGTCGTADTVLVNGVPATVVNGTFTLASLDLGGEGDRPLVIAASGPCGPRTANLNLNVDTLPPDVAIDRPAAGAWVAATPITVEGTVADPHLQSVRVGTVVASVAAGRFQAPGVVLVEGATSLTAVATDTVGNQSTSAPVTVNLDSSAPVLTITAPSAGTVVSQAPVTVRGTSDDPLLEIRVGTATGTVDNTKQPPEWTVPGVALSEGDNTLTVDGRNLAGTPGTPPSLLLALDTQPPVVSLSSTGVPPFTPLDRVTVSGSVFDAHLTSVTVNGVLATVTGGTFTAQNVPLAEGSNQLVATARDAGGLQATSGALSVTRDSVVPVIVLDALAQSLTNQRQLTVNGTITEANLTAITVNGVTATVTGNRFTATVPLTEGANAVRAHAEDLAGNVADSNTLSPELDTIPPAVAFSGVGLAANACAAGGAPLTVSGTYGDVHPATSNAIAIELRPAGGGAPTSVPVTLDASGRAFTAPGVVLGTVDGTAILIATATDGAGNSAKAVFSQRVDATTPTVRIVLDGAAFPGSVLGEVPGATPTLLNRTILPRAEVDDGSEAAPPVPVMTLDGSPYVAGTPIQAEGEHTLVARATDCAGHLGAASVRFFIDRTGPRLLTTTPAEGALSGQPVTTFSGTADVDLASAKLNGVPATVTGPAFTQTPFPWKEGPNAVRIELADAAGNVTAFDRTFSVKTLGPSIEILESGVPLATGALFYRTVTPTFRSNDPAAQIAVQLDGVAFTPGTVVSTPGERTLQATATDEAGHSASASVTFRIDLSAPPTVDITSPLEGAILPNPTTPVTGTAGASVTQVSVNGVPATGTTSWNAPAVPLDLDVPNDLRAVARDATGRTATAVRTVLSRSGGPKVVLIEPVNATRTNRRKIDVAGAVVGGAPFTANGTVTVTPQGGSALTVPLDPTGAFRAKDVPLQEGTTRIEVSATDAQGRTGTAAVDVVTDFTAPAIALTVDGQAVSDGATYARAVTVHVEVTDAGGALPPSVRLNGELLPVAGLSVDLPLQAAGGYVVAVIARDQAGNETRSERSLLVDLGGCGLADLTPESGTVIASNRVTLRGRAGSAASVTIRVPNPGSVPLTYADYPATVADGTFASADVPLPADGDNALQIVCTDRSGMAHTETLVLHRVSGAGPTITITAPASGAFVSTPGVTIAGSVSDPAAKLTVNGLDVPLTNGQFTKTGFPLAEGPNVLSARAVDAASRVGEARVVVHRDTAPPQVAITSPQTNQVFGASGLSGLAVEVSGVVDVFGEPNLQSVSVRLNGGAPVVATVDADSGVFRATVDVVVGPAAATHVVTVTATDALGQANVPAAQVSFSVDPLGPSILLTTPRDLVRFTESASSVTAQGAARGAAGSVVSLNGQGIDGISFTSPGPDGRSTSPFAGAQPLPAEDGSFTLVARVDEPGTAGTGGAAGTPGKTASVRRVLVKDTVAPTVVQFVPAQDAGAAATLVEPDALLLVLFSEPIAKSTLPTADGLLLKKVGSTVPVAGTYTLSGNAVAFLPGAKLEPGSEYVFRAGATLTDLSAHPLSGPQEVRVKVALSPTDSAPQLDALPAIVCQTTLRVTGRSVPGALVRLRDDDLVFSAYADQAGVFAIDLPISGNGYHLLRVVNVSRDGQSTGAAATALVRVDCSAPRVVSATFDRVAGLVRVDFSEPLDASTVQVGAETSSVRVSNGETMGSPAEAATLTVDGDARGLTLQLSTATDAFWRGRAVRLEVRPPAADPRGNPIAAFSTLFYPGAGPGDLSGSFLSGEVYDDESGRPLANALARLFTSTAALPGTGTEGMPVATGQTEARGRYGLAGDVPAGRYVLVLEKPGHARVLRRFALEPQTGAVPFDARLTPLAAAAATPYAPPAAYSTEVPSTLLKLDLAASAITGPGSLSVRLTAISGQGLPELLPLGYTPLAAAEVRLDSAGLALSEAMSFAPGTAFLTLPLRQAPDVSAQLLAARYDTATGQWLTLPLPQRSTGADGVVRARVELYGPGAVAVLLADADPAIRPPQAPTQTGQPLAGSALPATIPALAGALSLDPPTVPPTGRSTAKVVARSANGTSPWPSGLAVQAFLDEKLVLATGEEVFEAPFAADLVLYHYPLTAAEQGTATAAAAGAAFFRVSPSERAAQERLQSGFENIRLFAFPSEIERGQILGPQGGSIAGTDGVELTVPEGALGRRTIVKARLLTPAELASYAAPEGFALVTAVKVELEGQTLARQATLRLNVPQGTPPDAAGDPRLVLARFVEQAADGRSSYAGIVARGQRQSAQGSVPEKVTYAPEGGASTLPLAGLVAEGIYLVLRATASLGWATGLVKHESGAGVTNSRVSSPGLGTRDLTVPGGRYASAVLAGASRVIEALHPVNDERGSETLPTVGIGEVVQRDITIHPQGPTITGRQPADGATGVPIGSVVSLTFSEALDPSSIGPSTLTVEIANAAGAPSGVGIAGSVARSTDGQSIAFTPSAPLPPGRRFVAVFDGGARDSGGTPYRGELPLSWTFTTSTAVTYGGQVDASKIRLLVPVNGVAQIVGDPGALPAVPAGSTPWAVTAEIENAVLCASVQTTSASPSGSFAASAGCPPTGAAELSSKVLLNVFDPAGHLAHRVRLGPFVTPDGRGFVAEPGTVTRFTSIDGIRVEVPAESFESHRLVTVRMLPSQSFDVPLNAGLSLGAFIELDFEGRAARSLVVRIPMPQDAVVGRQAFVGRPTEAPWGKRLQFLSAGRVIDIGGQKFFSNGASDRPGDPPSVPRGSRAAGLGSQTLAQTALAPLYHVQNPWCTTVKIPCGTVCPDAPPSPPGCNAALTAPVPPGCNSCDCDDYLCSVLEEFGSRGRAAAVYSAINEAMTLAGSLADYLELNELNFAFNILYIAFQDTFIFVPPPGNWSGRFALPVQPDVPFDVVVRNRNTGWIEATRSYSGVAFSPDLVDIGGLGGPSGSPATSPLLIDATPFAVTRFLPRSVPPTATQPDCETVVLGVEACSTAQGVVELRPATDLPLAEYSRLAFFNVSTAPAAGPSAEVGASGTFATLTLPARARDDLMLVVSPADVESENLSVLKLSFDQALRPISSSVALLVDCGALPGDCASATPVLTTAELSPQRSQLWVKIEGSLSRGRLYKLSLNTNLLVADASPNPPYQGPGTFFLATRRQALTPVGGTSGLVLGDTAHAREILKLGNILFAASVTGRLVALDLTSAPSGSPPRMNPTALAATSGPASQIRGLATDGHGRIIYSALEGASWVVKVARLEDFQRVTTSGTSPPPPECDASGSNGRPPCACGLPFVPSVPMGCVNPTVGGVRTAFSTGFTAGLLGPEFLAVAGSLPSGTPVDIDVLVQDKNPDGKALPLGEFFARRPSGSLPAPGPDGFRTFAVDLSRNAPPQIQPQPRLAICDESSMDRFRRVSIDNLTTGQTWSFDMLDPAWGGPAGTEIATDIRARDNDLLQIRYNQRTWVYQAIVGSGITVVDVNRFYRTVSSPSSEPELLLSQCGRRLSAYEGQEIDFGQPLGSPGAIPGLFYTTGIAAIGQSEAGSVGGTIAGAESAEVYSALRSFGAVRSTAYVRSPDLLHGGKDDLRNLVPGRITNVRDVVALTDFEVPDPANGNRPGLRDLVFYTVFEGGVLVYDVTHRALTRFGRLGVPAGGAVNRLTLDRANARLFGEGTMAEAAGLVPKVFVWDITNPRGDPPAAPSQDPRLVSVLDAPSDAGLVVDSLTGLLYTWQNGSTPQTSGARTFAFGDPGIHALARLHGSSSGGVNLLSYELTDLVAPLGTPLRATVAEDLTNASEDDTYVSGAIRLRAALPAGLGDELTVKVQSLTERPDERHLADEDLGAFVGVPGGSRWGKSEVFVTLKRLSLASGRSGPLSELGSLYESVESIVFVSDPRALDGHTLQQATNTEADEESQCRRCKRPPHYPLPSAGTTDPVVEVMATGPYARFVLAEDPSNPSQATQDALAFLRSMGGHYRIPHGLVSLTGWAASIPSPFQSALAEPVLEPAIVETEAGTSVVLTSGEVLISTVDHGVAGRGLGFALDRSYRSQLLGYGPLGAAGFTSSLFAEVRRIPLFGRNCLSPEYGRTGTLVEFHDGEGQVYRFATKNPCPGPSAPVCPAGFVEDGASPYCPAKGLYMRLADEAGGGLRLYGENFDSLVFDSGGRLVEVRDRLRRNASRAEEQGNTLLLSRHPSGRLESVEDELGRKYTFQYDDEPYDAQGRIRPTFGLLTKVVDHADGDPAARREIDYVFDTERRLLAVRYPEVALRQASGGTTTTRPELRYHYAPAPLTAAAPHGAFAEARLTGFTIPGGLVPRLSIAYDPVTGRANAVTAPGGLTWTFTQAPSSATPASSVTVVSPVGLSSRYDLFPQSGTPDGRASVITHLDVPITDVSLPAATTAPGNVTERRVFLDDGRLQEMTSADLTKTAFTYRSLNDYLARNSVASIERSSPGSGSQTRSFGYAADNVPTGLTNDGVGRSVTNAVPDIDALSGVDSGFSDGARSKTSFDRHGRFVSVDTGAGAVISQAATHQADARGRPGKGFVSTVAQGDLFMNLGYDARGNLAKEESSQGVSRLVEYDEWDRVVRETSGIVSAGPLDPAPVVVEYGYDAAGRLAFEKRNQTQAAGGGSGIGTQVREVVTRYTYDERGQLLTMTEEGLAGPSGGVSATGTTTFSYQPGTGHLDTVTSPAGVVTKYRYDAAGRLAGERTEAPGVSPSPGESLRGYDILSRVNYQTDGDTAPGKVGEWKGIYDGFSRLVRQTLPTGAILEADYDQADGITEVRAKDAAGVLLSRISGVKLTTTGEVVDLSEHQGTGTPRRVQKTLDGAGRTTHVLNDGRVEREYEFQPATGRLLAEKTPTREQRYTYDGGSLWAKSVAAGEAQTGPSCSAFLPSTTTEIRRDAQGRPVAETKSDGKSTTYLWDEEGRPLLTREGSEAHILTWDSRGALARLNRPSGRGETTFGYDLDGRPIRQVHTVPGLLAPEVTSAGIDAAGRRTSLNLPDGGTELYRYDSDGELSEVTRPDGVRVGIERDRANRITRILPTASGPTRAVLDGGVELTYDVLSRLLETKRLPGPGGASGVDVGMPTYDLAGRVLSEVVAGRAPMQRSYDTKGRVLSVTLPSGTQLDRTYQTCSDRLETISGAGLSASFAWTGARLLGVTTSGARKVAHRYGYADGPGAPGGPGARVWQLATLTHGTAGTSNPLTEALHPLGDPQAPGSQPWGQLSYGYRKSDGAKLGRKVVASPSIGAGGSVPNVPSIVGLMGAAWDVDAGRRLREAALGEGSDSGDSGATGASGIEPDVRSKAAALFAYDYSNADQLAREVRVEGTASRIRTLSSGSDGRPESIQIDSLPATPIRYESGSLLESGRRQEDDRHLYEWYWHGKLAKVTKRPGTLNAGQETRYLYDGLGRLYSRETRDAAGQLTERREYVFEDERLVEEQSYIDTTSTSLRWRKTYLPGAVGAVTVKDERYLPGTTTPTSTTVSSYLRDELGSVLGLVEEAGSSGPAPLRQRFFYTPYGEAHVEIGPETRRALFEQSITTVNGQSQAPAADHLGGAVRVKLSIAIDPATYSGIVVEKLTGGAWGALQAAQLALGRGDADSEVLVLPLQGWALGSAYRVRVTPALKDAFARVALASEAQLQLPQPPPPGQPAALSFSWEKSFPVDYRTDEAAQWSGILFQNLYADDVTGLLYTPGRWYDPVTASWLSKDGGASDSPSLYAFVKGRPHELIDPMGEAGMTPDEQGAEEAGEDDEGEDPSFAHAEGSMERLRELSDQTEGFSDLTCLTKDTVVFTPEGYVPIGDLSVGKRVLTPETLVTLSKETEVSEKTHRLVKLRLESEALGGTVVEIDTLVSLEEIERDGLHVGAVLAIDADEIGPEHAEVLSIEPIPSLEDRPGRLVTSTFRHVRKGALAATLRAEDGEEDTVFLTREHPVFVEGWGYKRLGDVEVGECVRTTEGEELRLVSVVPVEGEVELRNLEIEGEHAYFAGYELALVHNASPTLARSAGGLSKKGPSSSAARATASASKKPRVSGAAGVVPSAKAARRVAIRRAAARFVNANRTGAGKAFKAGGKKKGRFFRKLGAKTEKFADEVIDLYSEVEILERGVELPSGRNYDRLLEVRRLRAMLEIKYSLSVRPEPFNRLVEQVRGMSGMMAGGKTPAAVWFLKKPTTRELTKFRKAVGPKAWQKVSRLHGIDGLAEYLQHLDEISRQSGD